MTEVGGHNNVVVSEGVNENLERKCGSGPYWLEAKVSGAFPALNPTLASPTRALPRLIGRAFKVNGQNLKM